MDKGRSPKQRLSHVAEGPRVAEDHVMKKSFVSGFVSVPLLLLLFLLSLHFLLRFSPSPSPSLSRISCLRDVRLPPWIDFLFCFFASFLGMIILMVTCMAIL